MIPTSDGDDTNSTTKSSLPCFGKAKSDRHHHLFPAPPRGYVIHYDTGARTSEGFGSHARGSLFPLIHIAATLGFQPLFCNASFKENTARDYSQLDVASFLGLQQAYSARDGIMLDESTCCTVLHFSTWTDGTIGSACGDAVQLGEFLKEYLHSRNDHDNNNNNKEEARERNNTSQRRPFLLCLTGTFRYMNPTPPVLEFLKMQSAQWRRRRRSTITRTMNDHPKKMQIVAHVRVPEDFCPQFWKDANSIDKVLRVLDLMEKSLRRNISNGRQDGGGTTSLAEHADIHIVTEQTFSKRDENLVLTRYPTARIHRGTTQSLLDDLQKLATSDIFIPSSSHLSALAGYLHDGEGGQVILLSDPSRYEYFQPHVDLLKPCPVILANDNNPRFHHAIQNVFLGTSTEQISITTSTHSNDGCCCDGSGEGSEKHACNDNPSASSDTGDDCRNSSSSSSSPQPVME